MWILAIIILSSGVATHSIEFDTEAECLQMAKWYHSTANVAVRIKTNCQKRS